MVFRNKWNIKFGIILAITLSMSEGEVGSGILSPELKEQLGDKFTGSNVLVLPSKKKKKGKKTISKPHNKRKKISDKGTTTEGESVQQEKKLSKKQKKRQNQLQEKVTKERQRKILYQQLLKHSLSTEEMKFLHSSRELGVKTPTKRQQLKRALQEERAGLPRSDPSVQLYKEKTVNTNFSEFPSQVRQIDRSTPMFTFEGTLPTAPMTQASEESSVWRKKKRKRKVPKKAKEKMQKKGFFTYDEESSKEGDKDSSSSEESEEDSLGGPTKKRKVDEQESKISENIENSETSKNNEKGIPKTGEEFEIQEKPTQSEPGLVQVPNPSGTNMETEATTEVDEKTVKKKEVPPNLSKDLNSDSEDEEKLLEVDKVQPETEAERRKRLENQKIVQQSKDIYQKIRQNDSKQDPLEAMLSEEGEKKITSDVEKETKDGKSTFYVHINRTEEITKQRNQLPISMEEQRIMEAINEEDIIIICGQTGSGKTTQVPQFLYEAGYGSPESNVPGLIGITEPRRVAAVSMSSRVSHEMNISPSEKGLVAYQIRYDHSLTSRTRIKFMTDGILLREIQDDFLLQKYSAIIIDEAHERSLNTDILLGLLSRIVPLRRELYNEQKPMDKSLNPPEKPSENSAGQNADKPLPKVLSPLKLIIMSATLRVSDFVENKRMFPHHLPRVISVESRQYPVTIRWNKVTPAENDVLNVTIKKVCKIHKEMPPGGILVFMTGQAEIELLCKKLRSKFGQYASTKKDQKNERGISLDNYAEKDTEEDEEDSNKKIGKNEKDTEKEKTSRKGKNGTKKMEGEVKDSKKEKKKKMEEDNKEKNDQEKDSGDKVSEDKNETKDMETEKKETSEKSEESQKKNLFPTKFLVLPLYSMLPPKLQLKVFEPVDATETRLVIVATNIAETSITIPGITYVVDTGRIRNKKFDHVIGMEYYTIEYTSKASVNQRAGRAGRVGPGIAFRLFSSAAYHNHFSDWSDPEILRTPIDSVVLAMKNMGINKIEGFPFPTPPTPEAVKGALTTLVNIGALNHKSKKQPITTLGKALVNFPISPRFGKMLLLGEQDNCQAYVIAIVAALSVGDPFLQVAPATDREEDENMDVEEKKKKKEERLNKLKRVKEAQAMWINPNSDLITWLNAIGAYEYQGGRDSEAFCVQHFLHAKNMKEIHDLRIQLTNLVNQSSNVDLKKNFNLYLEPPSREQKIILRQIIVAGFIDQVGKKVPEVDQDGRERKNSYKYVMVMSNEHGWIHPDSRVIKDAPEYIVYHQVVKSVKGTKPYFKGVTALHPNWLVDLGQPLVDFSPPLEVPDPYYDPQSDRVMCYATPKFGPHQWVLPHCSIEYPSGVDKYRYFARFMLEGSIVPELKQFQSSLLAQPSIMTKQWTHTNVASMIQPLVDFQIDNKAKLKERFTKDPSFMLQVVALWIDKSKHSELKEIWPPK